MKMMRKNWKDRKGVSPVIATILMVAITVVLAAVLYVMVMGFGGDDQSSITGTFTSKETLSSTEEKIRFGALSPSVDGSKISLRVDVMGPAEGTSETVSATYKWSETADTWTLTTPAALGPIVKAVDNADSTPDVIPIEYVDLAGDDTISSGDYITITHAVKAGEITDLKEGTYTITVSMLNAASGALIDSIEYSWVVAAA
jgi:flagellin-like protein